MVDKKDKKDEKKDLVPMASMEEKDLLDGLSDAFKEKIDPKDPDKDELLMFKCVKVEGKPPNDKKCGNLHFRHAGYVEIIIPYMLGAQKKQHEVQKASIQDWVGTYGFVKDMR